LVHSRKSYVRNYDKKFNGKDGVKENLLNWLQHQNKDFFAAGINKLIKRWDKCINIAGDYVEK